MLIFMLMLLLLVLLLLLGLAKFDEPDQRFVRCSKSLKHDCVTTRFVWVMAKSWRMHSIALGWWSVGRVVEYW